MMSVPRHLGDGLQILTAHDRAGGVVGKGSTTALVLGVMAFLSSSGVRRNSSLPGSPPERGAPRHGDQRSVAHEGRHGHDDLVAGVHQAADGQVDALAAAHGDHYLAGEIVPQAEAAPR